MANTISQAFVEQFKSNVIHLAEQQGSRLRGTVQEESVVGEKHNFERVGNVAVSAKTTRHTDTPVLDVPHSRRVLSMSDYHWADLVDQEDKIRMLISPESAYARAGANAMGQKMDDLVIAAATGNSVDGGGSNVALPTGQKITETGTDGLTLAKILSAKEILDGADVDPSEDRFLVIGSKQVTDLLNTTQVTSADYNTVRALATGDIDTYAGFKIIRSERLAVASSKRTCLAYTRSGMGLGVGANVTTKIDERADKSYAVQVYLAMTLGALRVEEEKVVSIECKES